MNSADVAEGVSLGEMVIYSAIPAISAIAAAALFYLVTEELLVKAHAVPETPLAGIMFFACFLGLMILKMVG